MAGRRSLATASGSGARAQWRDRAREHDSRNHCGAGQTDEETLGMLGRTYKDLAAYATKIGM